MNNKTFTFIPVGTMTRVSIKVVDAVTMNPTDMLGEVYLLTMADKTQYKLSRGDAFLLTLEQLMTFLDIGVGESDDQ
jgi:hypothetical protein